MFILLSYSWIICNYICLTFMDFSLRTLVINNSASLRCPTLSPPHFNETAEKENFESRADRENLHFGTTPQLQTESSY